MNSFKANALAAVTAGLAPIPVFGKRPVITGFQKWRGIGVAGVERLVARCPGAELAILTSLSKIAVIDIDLRKRKITRRIIQHLGWPAAISLTKRGWHLHYSNPDYIRGKVGIIESVDLKGAGKADLVLFPPAPGYYFIDPSTVLDDEPRKISFEEGLRAFDKLTPLERPKLLKLIRKYPKGW